MLLMRAHSSSGEHSLFSQGWSLFWKSQNIAGNCASTSIIVIYIPKKKDISYPDHFFCHWFFVSAHSVVRPYLRAQWPGLDEADELEARSTSRLLRQLRAELVRNLRKGFIVVRGLRKQSSTVCPKKSEPPKHFAITATNLRRFK